MDEVSQRARRRVSVIVTYLLYFGITGVMLPFMPAYLRSLGLSGGEIGVLLAVSPAMSLWAPPLWGRLADRLGRPDRVLGWAATGAFAAFLPMWALDRFPALLVTMAVYALFATALVPLIDSQALRAEAAGAGRYGWLRLFGSLGFLVTSSLFGLGVDRVDSRVVAVPLALLGALALWLQVGSPRVAPAPAAAGPRPVGRWVDGPLVLLLGACALHWMACAPYHGSLSIHLVALGHPPWVMGMVPTVGVLAELALMAVHPRLHISPRVLLVIAFLGSAVRWWAMSLVTSAEAIIALALLHSLTFGAFYLAAVGELVQRVPAERRASGQALFAAMTFGLGGFGGYLVSGWAYDRFGGAQLFALAGGLELLPALLAVLLPAANKSRAAGVVEAQPR